MKNIMAERQNNMQNINLTLNLKKNVICFFLTGLLGLSENQFYNSVHAVD